jgi:hypothetical protein
LQNLLQAMSENQFIKAKLVITANREAEEVFSLKN